jgi:type II secretory pathway pseudopilin PulG
VARIFVEKISLKERTRIFAVEEMNKYSEFRNPHSAIGNKGFTLIEIIILIVMAGILLPAIIVPFVSAVKGSGKPEMATTAMYLAHQKMEEFMKYRYLDSNLAPTDFTSWAPTGFTNYDWQWMIHYVDSDFNVVGDGLGPTNHRGYKRIRVQVRDPMQDIYEIYTVVAFFH